MTIYLLDEFAAAGAVNGRLPDEGAGTWTGIGGVAVAGGALVNSAAGGTNSASIDLGSVVVPIELQADVYLPERSGSNINEMVEFYLYETTPTSPYSEYKIYLTAFDSFVQWTFYGADGGSSESLQADWFATAIPSGSTVTLSVVLDGSEIKLKLNGTQVHSWVPSGGMQLFDAGVRLAVRFQAQFVASAMAVNRVGVGTYIPATVTRGVLLKVTNVTTIPGTPGNDGTPPTPATPSRSYTVQEEVCTWRVVGGSYQWVTDDNGVSAYMLVPDPGNQFASEGYSCQTTSRTVYVPGSPGSPGTPPTPPTPAQTTYDYNLGWNSGARSIGFFNADGYVEFVPVVATGIVVGLNDADESPGYFEIEHAWYFSGGVARVYENGAEVAYSGPFVIDSDVFKIERRGSTVRYRKNGALVYTSTKPSYGPVFLDASMYSGGDMLADAVIAPMVSAGMTDPATGEVGMRLPKLGLLGYSGAGYATATLTLPAYTISAGVWSKATMTLPKLSMLASNRVYGAASLELPGFTLTASGGMPVPAYALATLTMPRLSVLGFGLTGEIGFSTLYIPAMDMIASEGPYGEATLTLPAMRAVGSAYEGNGRAFMHEFMLPQITLAPQKLTALVMTEDMTVASLMSVEYVATAAMDESLTIDGAMAMARQRLASMFSVVNAGSATPVVNVNGGTGPGGIDGDDPYHPDVRRNSDVQVWAMDWDTAATTAYENYAYNSFAVIDGKAYGAKADGVYLLDGTTDSGVPVRASVNFGANDFGTTKDKAMPHAYVGVAASGQLYLRVQVDGGTSYTYQARSVDAKQQVQRFDFGKGLKGSYYTFELFNKAGADFDLDKIEFMPVVLSRRI